MSKSTQAGRETQKKLPLVLQRMLATPTDSKGKPLVGEEFSRFYEHNRQLSIVQSKEFQAEINTLHNGNPFKDIEYGRGKFSYTSSALAASIDVLHAKYDIELMPEQFRGKGWSYVNIEIGDKPANIPPSTDHSKFLELVQTEEIYATEEEKEAMKMLLAQMNADLEINQAPAA